MDPVATKAATDLITNLGLPGLVIVVLFFALKHVHSLYIEAQEKRITEAGENRTAIERNTSAMVALTEVVKDRKG